MDRTGQDRIVEWSGLGWLWGEHVSHTTVAMSLGILLLLGSINIALPVSGWVA